MRIRRLPQRVLYDVRVRARWIIIDSTTIRRWPSSFLPHVASEQSFGQPTCYYRTYLHVIHCVSSSPNYCQPKYFGSANIYSLLTSSDFLCRISKISPHKPKSSVQLQSFLTPIDFGSFGMINRLYNVTAPTVCVCYSTTCYMCYNIYINKYTDKHTMTPFNPCLPIQFIHRSPMWLSVTWMLLAHSPESTSKICHPPCIDGPICASKRMCSVWRRLPRKATTTKIKPKPYNLTSPSPLWLRVRYDFPSSPHTRTQHSHIYST